MSRLTLPVILLLTSLLSLPARGENITDLRQLLSSKQCPNCELQRAGLVLADLAGANMAGAKLQQANLSQANLAGADLSFADLRGASLNGANLTGAILVGADLRGADLRQSYLVQANLLGANLTNAAVQTAIGLPTQMLTPEQFYALGLVEANKRNYITALEQYNQALQLNPQFAPAYLGRALVLYRLTDEGGAMRDAQIAATLFEQQKNQEGVEAVRSFLGGIESVRNPGKGGNGVGIDLLQLFGGLSSVLFRLLF